MSHRHADAAQVASGGSLLLRYTESRDGGSRECKRSSACADANRRGTRSRLNYSGWWLWVPAFAGTTRMSHHLFRDHHVVHVRVGGEAPFVGERAVDHAGLLGDDEPVVEQMLCELVRGDELVPLMGAARQPAQHIFG